jgi:predicted transcriptional regulator
VFTVIVIVASLLTIPFICYFLCRKIKRVIPDEKITILDEEASDSAPALPQLIIKERPRTAKVYSSKKLNADIGDIEFELSHIASSREPLTVKVGNNISVIGEEISSYVDSHKTSHRPKVIVNSEHHPDSETPLPLE